MRAAIQMKCLFDFDKYFSLDSNLIFEYKKELNTIKY
jgi:hypothetical protein